MADAPELPKTITPYPVVANIEFAEGPIFDEDGYLYFVNYGQRGKLGRLAPRGLVESWIDTGGVVNGLKYDGNRGLVCADHGAKRVTRIDIDRKLIEVLTDLNVLKGVRDEDGWPIGNPAYVVRHPIERLQIDGRWTGEILTARSSDRHEQRAMKALADTLFAFMQKRDEAGRRDIALDFEPQPLQYRGDAVGCSRFLK